MVDFNDLDSAPESQGRIGSIPTRGPCAAFLAVVPG